ncbi:MAG: DNA repair protein RecO C-terminal domain-containing protein, partial [Oscillospiraceae bacterium]|nr:DNA repair protein RecO C-terminal domain-containing protein [Oscillospiraceae bacterium]
MWILSLILALILVAGVQVWVFHHFGFRKLSYKRWFEPSIANEGDHILMIETVRNEKLLPLPWVRIEAQISPNIVFGDGETAAADERRFQRSIFSLAPYMNITRRHYVTATKRGYYYIDSGEPIKSYYSLGEDIDKYFAASYALELTDKLVPEGLPQPELFRLLAGYFRELG